MDSSRISPTAHYTGYVWCRHGLSPAALATPTGKAMYHALRGPMHLARRTTSGLTLEQWLLQRHGMIDHLLGEAIERGEVGQVVEIAAGLSGRGYRFKRRFADLVYVEGDLPGMVENKRRMLAELPHARGHYVVPLDALADTGDESLDGVAAELLDPTKGTAVITEGLLSYFDTFAVLGMFRRFAACLGRFPRGLYLTDLHPDDEVHNQRAVRVFRKLLGVFARGDVTMHFRRAEDAAAALVAAGFASAEVHVPSDHPQLGLPRPDFARVLAGRT